MSLASTMAAIAKRVFAGNVIWDTGNYLDVIGYCRLDVTSTSVLTLSRVNGRTLPINGALCTIPAAGITLSNSGLSASTLYYVYAYMNAGVMTLEASTTTFIADTTYGYKVKTGDATRTLVGMVYPLTGVAFTDSLTNRLCLSYFNRRMKPMYATPGQINIGNTSFAELSTGYRCNFLHWGDGSVDASASGPLSQNTGSAAVVFNIMIDGSSAGTTGYFQPYSANFTSSGISVMYGQQPSTGFHYLTVGGNVSSGTGILSIGVVASVPC